MGGRRLVDDVVDGVFTLINNGVLLTDFVEETKCRSATSSRSSPIRRSRFLRARIPTITPGNKLHGIKNRVRTLTRAK